MVENCVAQFDHCIQSLAELVVILNRNANDDTVSPRGFSPKTPTCGCNCMVRVVIVGYQFTDAAGQGGSAICTEKKKWT